MNIFIGPSDKQAFSVCFKASEQGDAQAQFLLAKMYENGNGVKQNYAEAIKWYRKSAARGYAKSQHNLGGLYANGQGVNRDYTEAVKWWRKAAKQGVARSLYNLGIAYNYGRGVRKNNFEAVKWYRKAARKGVAFAQFNLGMMYVNGRGVERDYVEAVKWYRKAADQKFAYAEFNLGSMYFTGRGVLQSGSAAADWYYKAGLSFIKDGKRDNALTCVERIKDLPKRGLTVPNAFLADKLLAQIYGGGTQSVNPQTKQGRKPKAKHQAAFGTGWPVVGGFVVTNHHVVAGHKKNCASPAGWCEDFR